MPRPFSVIVAEPPARVTGGWATPSTVNTTVPVGMPLPGDTGLTVAVICTCWPKTGLGVGVETAMEVAAEVTVWMNGLPELLDGENPTRVEYLWQKLYRAHRDMRGGPFMVHTIAGLDMALWDLTGKLYGVPLYRLLGGPTRDRIRVYPTDKAHKVPPHGIYDHSGNPSDISRMVNAIKEFQKSRANLRTMGSSLMNRPHRLERVRLRGRLVGAVPLHPREPQREAGRILRGLLHVVERHLHDQRDRVPHLPTPATDMSVSPHHYSS